MDLGDRMKFYEQAECSRRLMPLLPAMARIDGRSFHSFTKGLERPFCSSLRELMVFVTKDLVSKTNAVVGYTQSDEISLCWLQNNFESQIFFDGKIQKMVSQLAAIATESFNRNMLDYLPETYYLKAPTFDARVWNVPNEMEAANVFIWRELDATRNSITMAAQSLYSHRELDGKNCNEMQEMLFTKGVNWNYYPDWAKRGTFARRILEERLLTDEEISKFPKGPNIMINPLRPVKRHKLISYNLPRLLSIQNVTDVLFRGIEPVLQE